MTSKTATDTFTSDTLETVVYAYNLQNRLSQVTTTPYVSNVPQTPEVTAYTYDPQGVRTGKEVDGITTVYHIDPHNPTGYAQVLEESVWDMTDPEDPVFEKSVTYTIGDDILSQSSTVSGVKYLLCDGHGSTRQLADPDGTVHESYSYDGYGVMLGASTDPDPARSADTTLLYTGEQYDAQLDQYYLRARYYNQNNGTFNRMDPYSGNTQDPQSLHKYLYCHNNPVNSIDPSGKTSLMEIKATMANIGRAFIRFYPFLKWGLVIDDILTLTRIALKVFNGGLSAVSAWEWTEFALITASAIAGGSIARRIAKTLICRALKIPLGITKSLPLFKKFIEAEGVIVEISRISKYTKYGEPIAGEFDIIEGAISKPMITLYNNGHDIATLIHEYLHYHQWKKYVGILSRQDWINFINIDKYEFYLDSVAHFVSDVFMK